jgi:hypothetical protein
MRKPLLVLRTFMSLSLACMLTLPAIAQQELPYFREVLQRQQLARQLAPGQKTKLATIKATTTLTAAGACDVGTNGDFESQITPPTYLNNIGGGALASGTGATNAPDQLVSWYSPTGGSPDYWAENAGPPSANGPTSVHPGADMRPSQALYGPFTPHSPSGAVGLYYNASANTAAEYIRTSISPLVSGARYYVEYWVSLSRNANVSTSSINQNFGLVFGMTGITNGRQYLAAPTSANVISILAGIGQNAINNGNASDWKRVSRQFNGNGASTMTFGLFSTNTNGSPGDFQQYTTGNSNPMAYVFLDDVALYKIPTAGTGSTVCNQDVTLGEGCEQIPNATYAWTTSTNSIPFSTTLHPTVHPNATTSYNLTVTLPDNSTYTTSVTLSVDQPMAGPDHYICPGGSATLGVGCDIQGATYSWRIEGSSTVFATILHPTVYPGQATSYILTVRLPNGSTYTSRTTVTITQLITNAPDINLARRGAPGPQTGCCDTYDVRVNNVGAATSFTFYIENPDGNGGWTASGSTPTPAPQNVYTGPDNSSSNELQGFTTFHAGLIGPVNYPTPSNPQPGSQGLTYRFTVTAVNDCSRVIAQRVITIPPYGGEAKKAASLPHQPILILLLRCSPCPQAPSKPLCLIARGK